MDTLVVEDLDRLREVDEPNVSPDGREVLYSVTTVDVEADERHSDLFLVATDGTGRLQLTHTPDASEHTPRFSADGRRIAFLSDRGDEREVDQLWVMERAGGEARRVTDLPGGVEDYAWAPDGLRLVLVVADPDPDALREVDDPDAPPVPVVIDRYAFLADGVGWLRDLRSHLWLLDLSTGDATPLGTGPYDELLPAVSPDGTRVAFVSKRGEDPDRSIDWNVYVMELRPDAPALRITPGPGPDNDPELESRPAWSPDGRTLAVVLGGAPERIYYATFRVALVPADASGPPVPVLDADRNTWAPVFSADGRDVLYLLEDDGSDLVGRSPVRGGKPGVATPAPATVDAFAAGGKEVVVLASDPRRPPELVRVGKTPTRLTDENAWLADKRLAEMRAVSFPSADGTEIHGFLVTPPGYAGGPLPTILRIHGGPVSQYRADWRFDWQLFAAHGYAVVAANPRGSSGRGEDFAMAIWAAWGERDTEDVLAAVDHAVRTGVADPERLGVGGWSYGGILTDHVIARDGRFRAAISGAGLANALAGYGTDMYVREYEAELGLPWRDTEVWLKNSYPFLHADRIRTPTLFLCGDQDWNVPLVHSQQLYQALRSLGVPTELVVYPGETHDIDRPSFARDRLQRYLDWYGRWLVAP